MNFRYTIRAILYFPLLPLMYFQGKRIKNSVPSLPEAEGTEGRSTSNGSTQRTIRMLAIGESTIAGVGVQTHKEGFTGTLADTLSQHLGVDIIWKVYAKSGYTAKAVTQRIIPQITETEIDLLIVGIGGNDAFTLNKPKRWKKEVRELIITLKEKSPNTPIVFCNMPPIKEFPAFTSLIKATIGKLVEVLGEELLEVIKEFDNVYYKHEIITLSSWNKKFGFDHKPSYYFSDGVHPSKFAYQAWGRHLADEIVSQEKLKNALQQKS
ncbi:SGNH/GDSL hydrolase family protein [Arcticibacterium luteifluviistationis]|uniref:GDSL family lipase n=1 Tax=Arcticibacterium luteifluviistationis TaxID=1784714 RepID=A0A2Z4G795_9BACT|nr:SGNH/GDSL hydrolase family protein [Arcticibacterium luteifluviistationis]AWV97052.1 GDSL family lipase [Arcticibacterium luteifluviistationis]